MMPEIMFIARRLLATGILLSPLMCRADTIGYWRFEEGSGNVTADQTGVYNGDLIGFYDYSPGAGDTTGTGWSTNVSSATVPQTGESNTGAIRMGGGGEFIDLSNGQDMYLGYEFTVEMFMLPTDPTVGTALFGLTPLSQLGAILFMDGSTLTLGLGFQSSEVYFPATGVLIDQWQHLAIVKTLGEYEVYLNGLLLASDSLPSSADGPYYFPGTDNTGDRTIGGDSGTFSGWLDEFRISDTALTPDQFLCAYGIPEPGTLTLLALGLAALGLHRRK